MRKLLTLLAVACMLPMFSSCNKQGEMGGGKGNLKYGQHLSSAKTFQFDGNIVSANADGQYIAKINEALLAEGNKAAVNFVYRSGNYHVDANGVYHFIGLGTITIESDGSITFTPEGGSAEDEKVFTAPEIKTPDTTNEDATTLNGTWESQESIVTFNGLDMSFDGLDLNKIEDFAKKQGVIFNESFPDNMVMTEAIITDSFICITFANGEVFMGEYDMSQGTTFEINEVSDSGIELFDGTASIQFIDGVAVLVVDTDINGNSAKAIMTLGPAA